MSRHRVVVVCSRIAGGASGGDHGGCASGKRFQQRMVLSKDS